MTLYIARNGEKLGPFSLTEAQNLVRTGSVSTADLAWYEGLTTWIPLHQVPGLESADATSGPTAMTGMAGVPQPPAQRPVLVWIICIFYFVVIPISLMSMSLVPYLKSLNLPLPAGQRHYFENLGLLNYYLPAITALLLLLIWAIQLFRLKRNSIYFLAVAIVIGLVMAIYNAFAIGLIEGGGIFALFGASFGLAIRCALLWYNWYLLKTGVLR